MGFALNIIKCSWEILVKSPSFALGIWKYAAHPVCAPVFLKFQEVRRTLPKFWSCLAFDIDSLSQTMNYHPVLAENQSNPIAGFQVTEKAGEEGTQTYVLFPVLSDGSTNPKNNKDAHTAREQGDKAVNKDKVFAAGLEFTNSTNDFTTAGPLVSAAELNFTNSTNDFSAAGPSNAAMPNLEDLSHNADNVGAEADTNNMEFTRSMAKGVRDQGGISRMFNEDFHTFWILVDLPHGKRAIGTKWVYRNKKDERGIVIRNKARLIALGHTQEKGIDYEEVFAPVARIEAIRLFLAYASFMGFPVYQMDVKSAFLYGTIEEEVYICQPSGFDDPEHPDKVYKVIKALYGLHQAPRAWVSNNRTRIVQETFHVNFMENKPNVAGSGPTWLFDIDSLTRTMNYHLVIAENQTNSNTGFQDTEKVEEEGIQTYVLFPVLSNGSTNSQNNNKDALVDGKEHDDNIQKSVSLDIHFSSSGAQSRKQGDKTENKDKGKSHVVTITGFRDLNTEFEKCINNSSNGVNAASSSVSTAGHNFINSTNDFSDAGPSNAAMPNVEDLTHSNDADDVGPEADINNLEFIISVSPIPTTRIHKDHPTSQIIGDLSSTTQTRSIARAVRDQGGISQMFNEDFHTCMFACILLQEEPKRVHQALKDPSWIEAMQEELLQFKMQKVWILVDLPYGKRVIGTKWVYRNKKDERGIVIRNKTRLVAQGHTQDKGIDYEEVFAPVARIEAIRLFLAYASFMGFPVYQMDVKSTFLYGTIEEEVYVCQPPGFEDPENPDKVNKVVKALYGLHQAPRAWYETLATYLL
nr:putative ribonuclease H-like domain-containing protein [Tanacetum cinerariifolium]